MDATTPDHELVEKVLAGETGAFRALLERYRDAVYGVILSKIGSFADVEDLAQDTFLTAFEKLGTLRQPSRFGAWLYRIALNKVRTYLRRRRSGPARDAPLALAAERAASPDDLAAGEEKRAAILTAMARLSDAHRETATLYYINGYSQHDISRFTNRPVGTIRRRLHDARKRLQKELITMVETELKQSRPGKTFTERIIGRITRTRVRLTGDGGQHNYVLLCDSQGNCYETVPLVGHEAQAILSRLGQAGPSDVISIYTSFVELLDRFGCRVSEVTLSQSTVPNFLVRLRLRSRRHGERTVESLWSGYHAFQLGIHSRADFFLDRELADRLMIRRKDGKPLSEKAAWRRIAKRTIPAPKTMAQLLRELETNPASPAARRALSDKVQPGKQLRGGQGPSETIDELKRWARKHKGTTMEGVAAGLIGAIYLSAFPEPMLPQALPYLERAHRCDDGDESIAFDLATAYAMTDNANGAFSLLRRFKFEDAPRCRNFEKLWDDPRFVELVGEPDVRMKTVLVVKQTYWRHVMAKPQPGRRSSPFQVTVAKVATGLPKGIPAGWGGGSLLGVEQLIGPFRKTKGQRILLACANGRAAAIAFPEHPDPRGGDLDHVLQQDDRPWREPSESVFEILRDLDIGVEAVVLNEAHGETVSADLIARQGQRWARAAADALFALALAAHAERPILITETLAEKLYVRGQSGKPLTVAGAIRKLRSR